MLQDAQVYLGGYVATEPKFKKVAGDTSFARLRVAYTARRRDKETGEWSDGPTSFVSIQCWRTLAENVHMSVHKGEPVLVMGRLQVRRFDDASGTPRTAVEVEATSVGHDLARGVASFSRTRWPVAVAAEADGALAAGPAGPEDAAEPGESVEPGDGTELTGAPDATGRVAAAHGGMSGGDSVIDESAVAEFARSLADAPGAGVAGTQADAVEDARADAGVGVPA